MENRTMTRIFIVTWGVTASHMWNAKSFTLKREAVPYAKTKKEKYVVELSSLDFTRWGTGFNKRVLPMDSPDSKEDRLYAGWLKATGDVHKRRMDNDGYAEIE